MKFSLLLLALCTPAADAIFGFSSIIGTDSCKLNGKSVADNGLCEELFLKGTVDSDERCCAPGTDTTDCARDYSLDGWRFDCGDGYGLAFSEEGDYSSVSVNCCTPGGDYRGTPCGKYIWNGAALGLKGKFFGNDEKTVSINRHDNSADFSFWRKALYQFEMEIPGIGKRRCHAVATNANAYAVALSGRNTQNFVTLTCPKSTGPDNAYAKTGDTIQLEFGRAGDIIVLSNGKKIATGIFIKYGEKCDYTALFAPSQPQGGSGYENKELHGQFTMSDVLYNDWHNPTVGCTRDLNSLYTVKELPLWERNAPNAIDPCFGHKYDPCNRCTTNSKGDPVYTATPCARENTVPASDESCMDKSQFYCVLSSTCVNQCTSCVGNTKLPLEGRYFIGPNTCSPGAPEYPWQWLGDKCGDVDTVRSEQLQGVSLSDCKKACQDKADCVGVDFLGKWGTCNIYTQMCQNPPQGVPDEQGSSHCLRNCCRNSAGEKCDDYNHGTINDKCQDTSEGPKCVGTEFAKMSVDEYCEAAPPMCHKFIVNGETLSCDPVPISGTPCSGDSICSDGLCIGKQDVLRVCGGKQICADVFPKLADCDTKWKDGCSSVPPTGYTVDSSGSDLCPSTCGGSATRPSTVRVVGLTTADPAGTHPAGPTTTAKDVGEITEGREEEDDETEDDDDAATPITFTASIFIILSVLRY